MKRTTVFLEDEQLEQLQRLAERRNVTMSSLLRDAIETLLESDTVTLESLERRVKAIESMIDKIERG